MDADSSLHLLTASSVSAATRVSVSATAAATAPAEVSPLILSNASSSLKLGLEGSDVTATKSSTNRLSGADKIESVHESIDDARAAIDLLSNLTSFLDTVINDSNRSLMNSVGEAINVCRSILDRHVNTVSRLVNNTKEKRSSKQAHSKLTKRKKLEEQHAKLEMNRAMKNNPKFTLKAAIKRAKLSLDKHGGEGTDMISAGEMKKRGSAESTLASTSLPPRQSKKLKTPEGDDGAQQSLVVRVPRPSNGAAIYTPYELRAVLRELDGNIEQLAGTANKNLQRSFKARYKEEIMNKGYAPFQKSAMNKFESKHVKGKEEPPLFWNQKGRTEYLSIDDLHAKFQEKGQRIGQGWSTEDTKKAVTEAKRKSAEEKGQDPHQVTPPDKKTVDAYHAALMSLPNIVQRTAKSKPIYREIAETAPRAMMSNLTGMLSVLGVIETKEFPIPVHLKFDASRASEGEILARRIFAKAMRVPEELVHFIPRALFLNTDDMAIIYVPKEETDASNDQSVLVDVSNTINTSYGIHSSDVKNQTRCNELKTRITNTITGGGQYLPVFAQMPGFTESEIPRSKVPLGVVLLEVKGLAPDGNINPHSDHVGYVALIRGNEKDCEAEVFRLYEELVRQPSIDRIRKNANLDPSHPMSRAVVTIDGGVPQLNANIDYSKAKTDRNETLVKYHKNTSSVTQANDTGDGHKRTRHHMKKVTAKDTASISVLTQISHCLAIAKSMGYLDITSAKNDNIIEVVGRLPTVLRKSYTEESINRAFTIPGWLGSSLQGVDVFQVFKQLKRTYTTEETEKWIADAPTFVEMYSKSGVFSEELAQSLGYAEDSDASGNEHPQNASMISQHHRQRLTIPTHPSLMPQLLSRNNDAAINAREQLREALVAERRWRHDTLEANQNVEKKLHRLSGRADDADRSLLSDDNLLSDERVNAIGKLSKDEATAFVLSRSITSKSDKTFSKPSNKGNANLLKTTLAKLQANSNARLDKKENTWVYHAWKLYKNPLTLVQLEDIADDSADPTPTATTTPCASTRNAIVRVNVEHSFEGFTSHSILDNISLVNETCECFVDCLMEEETVPKSLPKTRDLFVEKILPRLKIFRQLSTMYNTHWTLDAFIDNLGSLCDVIALADKIPPNIESLGTNEFLLRSLATVNYRNLSCDEDGTLQGVGLYADKERGSLRRSVSVHGTDEKNFKWRYDQDLKLSKKSDPTNALFKKYPFKKPSLSSEGGYHGTFGDLELRIGVGYDPTKENSCLTREVDGLFVWSEATLNNLKESKVADDLRTKKRILVCCMFELLFHLTLDARIRSEIPLKAFSPFIVAQK